jgi:hypothetical protein
MNDFTIDQSYAIQQIINQLESCGFKDKHDHKLEMNVAFIKLKKIAKGEKYD